MSDRGVAGGAPTGADGLLAAGADGHPDGVADAVGPGGQLAGDRPAARGPGVVGYVPGAYDMFHIGHLNILRRAKAACDYLIAGVVLDDVVAAAKGKWPVVPHGERMEIVAHIECVDEVVADTSSDKYVMWEKLRFDVLFKGDDWKGTAKGDRLEASLGAVGVRVVYFPYTVHTSSTMLRRLISDAGAS